MWNILLKLTHDLKNDWLHRTQLTALSLAGSSFPEKLENILQLTLFVLKCKCITWEDSHSSSVSVAALSGSFKASDRRDDHSGFISKRWTTFSWITEVNNCRCRALRMCWGFGTCVCRTLCRTEQIRMKYWVHLWISGAERPLVGASACIFSWWKPLDGSFLLAASLNSESQKCNASWTKKKNQDL